MFAALTPTLIVIMIVCIVISLAIHEFMHAYVGHLLGDTTAHDEGRMTLNPLSHIDPVMTLALPIVTILAFGFPILAAKPVPFNPDRVKFDEFGAALIAAAGPFSNLVLAIIAALIANVMGLATPLVNDIFTIFITLNVALFVFNLVPIPPLDGSRVLYAFAPEPVQQFMRSIEPFGLFVVFGLIFLGLGSFLVGINQAVINFLP